MRLHTTNLSKWFGASVVAAGIVMVLVPSAKAFQTPGTITACYDNATGQMRRVATAADCKAKEVALTWNIVGPQGPEGLQGIQGLQGLQGLSGPAGPAGPGLVGSVYVIPGGGGSAGGGYLQLSTANNRASLFLTCNYGFPGDNEAFWFATSPGVTAGSVKIFNVVNGLAPQMFADLQSGSGGQDRAFPATSFQGTWPYHAVFSAVDGSSVSRFDVTVFGSAGGPCTVLLYSTGLGLATVVHP